jgi:hypothetical protein
MKQKLDLRVRPFLGDFIAIVAAITLAGALMAQPSPPAGKVSQEIQQRQSH